MADTHADADLFRRRSGILTEVVLELSKGTVVGDPVEMARTLVSDRNSLLTERNAFRARAERAERLLLTP